MLKDYHEYLKGLALAVGIENPTREQLARLDRKRKKKGSNEQWMSPADPDARITKMKGAPVSTLYPNVLDGAGVPTEQFGDSQGRLQYLTDLT